MPKQREKRKRSIIGRAIICLLVLAAAGGGFVALKSVKQPPVKANRQERPLKVETFTAHKKDVPVFLNGYGELKPIKQVAISAEVAGRVIEVHPRLQAGEHIPEGELLFRIDDSEYETEYQLNKKRVAILRKDLELAKKELSRVRTLFDKNKVGTAAGVEAAEKTVNNSADRLAQAELATSRAQYDYVRSVVLAPFTARVVMSDLEQGQYVTPGKTIITIADDSWLEVEVPIYSRDAAEWLIFSPDDIINQNWFEISQHIEARVRWTESEDAIFNGFVHRVSSYSAETRNVHVVIRIGREENKDNRATHGVPLVAGMFVSVEIPGRIMENVIPIPRVAVSFENRVSLVRNDRLATVEVEVVRVQGDYAYIGSGLEEGDQIVTTRLVNPLEGSKLIIVGTEEPKR